MKLFAAIVLCSALDVAGAYIENPSIKVKAPIPTGNILKESIPMLYASQFAYGFGDFVKAARNGEIELKVPENFPIDISKFEDESCDFKEIHEHGNGLSFREIQQWIDLNTDEIQKIFDMDDNPDKSQNQLRYEMLDTIQNFQQMMKEEKPEEDDKIYLTAYRSIQSSISCVYSIIKDEHNKRIIVGFRGSQAPDFSTRDWRTNFRATLAKMPTPGLIKHLMKKKRDRENILVHEGFYNYLFDNDDLTNEQRYEKILSDIKPIMEPEYSIYVTGHSLGGALATMFAFRLAGDDVHDDWIPKPIQCYSFAAPFSGAAAYREAAEHMEKEGLLRHLRTNNDNDLVPSVPPFSLGWPYKRMKHIGINLRLTNKKIKIVHPTNQGLFSKLENNAFKPVWNIMKYHLLPLHNERLMKHKDKLSSMKLEEMYEDRKIVGKKFIANKKK